MRSAVSRVSAAAGRLLSLAPWSALERLVLLHLALRPDPDCRSDAGMSRFLGVRRSSVCRVTLGLARRGVLERSALGWVLTPVVLAGGPLPAAPVAVSRFSMADARAGAAASHAGAAARAFSALVGGPVVVVPAVSRSSEVARRGVLVSDLSPGELARLRAGRPFKVGSVSVLPGSALAAKLLSALSALGS